MIEIDSEYSISAYLFPLMAGHLNALSHPYAPEGLPAGILYTFYYSTYFNFLF